MIFGKGEANKKLSSSLIQIEKYNIGVIIIIKTKTPKPLKSNKCSGII